MSLNGKVAFVTGAGRGIGRGIALSLAREGVDLIISDIDVTSAEGVVKEVKDLGRQAIAVRVDVKKSDEVKAGVETAITEFGRIDILVNNAGIIKVAPIQNLKEEDWDAVLDTNVKGAFLCSKYTVPHMIEQRSGKIINVASIAGKIGWATGGAYCASKFAIVGLTQVMATELGQYNITVNAVCPGMVWTYMQEYLEKENYKATGSSYGDITKRLLLGRDQSVDDIGSAVVFLASEHANNITGQSINVDGGMVFH
jgi:meso-butanediol dehydrogenase/(S,S)-butanediol dehydrogenase/diacetyl reductase